MSKRSTAGASSARRGPVYKLPDYYCLFAIQRRHPPNQRRSVARTLSSQSGSAATHCPMGRTVGGDYRSTSEHVVHAARYSATIRADDYALLLDFAAARNSREADSVTAILTATATDTGGRDECWRKTTAWKYNKLLLVGRQRTMASATLNQRVRSSSLRRPTRNFSNKSRLLPR
jgi:hypothetical protein